jgi:4-hydroxybenzoate polyprenyltransferase
VAVGLLGNLVLRTGWLSWLPWAVSYALLPAFLSYGGWGGDATGNPPEIVITVLAALLGVGVHVLVALPGLVADHEDGLRHLPLRLGLRLGAAKVLVLASVWTTLVVVALLLAGNAVGLSQ